MYYLGIDGGGTTTEFSLIDKNGNVLSHTSLGTTHIMQITKGEFISTIIKGTDLVLKKANIEKSELSYIFAGIPGYGEFQFEAEFINNAFKDIMQTEKFLIGNDSVAAWAGSLGAKPGINIVSGTGAICFGKDEKGNEARTSGWGSFCGDEGSAFWLGKAAINLFTKQSDGRLEKTEIYDILKKELKINDDFEIIEMLKKKFKYNRTKIAQFSIYLYKAATKGDPYARDIYKDAAYELYTSTIACAKKLEFKNVIQVSTTGGVFNAGDIILKPLRELFSKNPRFNLVSPITTPAKGACLYAYVLDGNKLNDRFIENIKKPV